MTDYISRADAIEAVCGKCSTETRMECALNGYFCCDRRELEALPSADAVQSWRIGKPTEQGKYIVTVDSMRHGMVELMYYGKPIIPNMAVKGMCWYRDDDEWGDVVYDDTDILAWMPLPTPYKGGDDE